MIVAVINLKGGVGKTTSSIALATAAARDGREAVVLDADVQSSASLWAMTADDLGEPLPFDVRPANLMTMKALEQRRPRWDDFIVIDAPPTGTIMDKAKENADVVVVPTSASSIDLQQTWATVDSFKVAGKPYAILVVKAEKNTTAYREARRALRGRDESYFKAVIPKRADLVNAFGHRFGDDLYGYEKVYEALKEMMD